MTPTTAPRRPPTFGPEPWAEVAGTFWCHWDLWYCIVAVVDHDGSLDALEAELVAQLGRPGSSRDTAEAKLSHLVDLRQRLASAGLGPSELVGAEVRADKVLVAKARRKLADSGLEARAMTPAMVETPRVRLTRRARTGRWPTFPVDPAGYYKSFRRHVEVRDHITKNRTFALTRLLEERLDRLDAAAKSVGQRLGLYRAFHTAGLELQDRGDDSYGNIGDLRQQAWATYLGLDWRATGMPVPDYWADLVGLVVFEDYGLGYKDQPRPWRGVAAGEAELVEPMLVDLADELRAVHLDYQADEALVQIGWLHVAGRRFSRYEQAANRIGSRNWQPIMVMAESALRAGRHELAVAVFRAADQPGFHREHLRERCQALTGVAVGDDGDHLRVVR